MESTLMGRPKKKQSEPGKPPEFRHVGMRSLGRLGEMARRRG